MLVRGGQIFLDGPVRESATRQGDLKEGGGFGEGV